LETPLKSLMDKFRAKPEWQHQDPAVRAEAVLRLPAAERATLVAIARGDQDARVRRAALKRFSDPALLAERAREDADEGVREEAGAHLASLAIHATDAAAGETAVAGLGEARHLATVAKSATHAAVRQAAVARLQDSKHLAVVVRECTDNGTRLLALGLIEDPLVLFSFALKSDQKAVALASVERLTDRAQLQATAERARVPAVGRRARARLEAMTPAAASEAPEPAPVPAGMDDQERLAYERARAAHEQEAAGRSRAAQARVALCDSLDQAESEAIPAALDEARAAWNALAPLPGPEGEALARRFEAAVNEAGRRHEALQAGAAWRGELDALCAQAEELAGSADLAAARAGWSALSAKRAERASSPEAAALAPRFEAAEQRLREREAAARGDQARKEKDNLARLGSLCGRMEALARAAAPGVREVDHALGDAREALDDPGPLPSRRDREALLARLESARKVLYPIGQQLREDTEWKRWANVAVQEELCAKAETLLALEDIEQVAVQVRDLDARWKQAKEAPKEKGEALWNRFKAARDQAKARCDAYFAKQAEELAAHVKAKEALCARAEALAESAEWLATTETLKKLQEEWKQVGPVARPVSEALWRRFRKPCDRFFARRKEHQHEREQDWARNLERKVALATQAEALRESTDWEATSTELKRLQGEWRTIGAVRKNKSEAVWQRFRKACDHFFERYKDRDNLERQAAIAAREALCGELEALAPEAAPADGAMPSDVMPPAEPPADLAARVQAAVGAWRQAGEVSREQLEALNGRFASARNRLIERWPGSFEGTDLDPEANRQKAEKLCARVEEVLASLSPGNAAVSGQDLAARIKDALASNTIGGQAAVEEKWQAAAAEIETAQSAWQRLGPVPGEAGRALAARFDAAGRRFQEKRPRIETPRPAANSGRDRPVGSRERTSGPRDRDGRNHDRDGRGRDRGAGAPHDAAGARDRRR
jgi:hypothetical protein